MMNSSRNIPKLPILRFLSEEKTDDKISDDHRNAIFNVEILNDKVKAYQRGLLLQATSTRLQETKSFLVPAVTAKILKHEDDVRSFLADVMDYSDDVRIASLCQSLKDSEQAINKALIQAQEVEMSSISKTTMSSPEKPCHYSSRVKVPLPKFDGSPLDWKRFLELFTSIIEKDVSLSESEKCCLLTDAMSTPETKELVKAATLGSDGYNQGMRAYVRNTAERG